MTQAFKDHVKRILNIPKGSACRMKDGKVLVTDGPRVILLPPEADAGVLDKEPARARDWLEKSVRRLLEAREKADYRAVRLPPLRDMRKGIQEASGGRRGVRVVWSNEKSLITYNARFLASAMEALHGKMLFVPGDDQEKNPAIIFQDDFVMYDEPQERAIEFIFPCIRKTPTAGFAVFEREE